MYGTLPGSWPKPFGTSFRRYLNAEWSVAHRWLLLFTAPLTKLAHSPLSAQAPAVRSQEPFMNRKWFAIAALIVAAILLLSVASCGDPQTLQSITIQPGTETVGASNIPVPADAGFQVQLRALGNYLHPPATKDITGQVTWNSNTPQMFTVSSGGLLTATGVDCGGTLVSATMQTNKDGSGVSSSGAVVTGYMTANVVCFTSSGSGGGSAEPILTVNFQGSGTGTVASSTSGFSCASTAVSCVDSFPSGTSVTLNAIPVSPSTFGGWSGACTGTGSCTILMQSDSTVTAAFN
jgi:hypothetical protein